MFGKFSKEKLPVNDRADKSKEGHRFRPFRFGAKNKRIKIEGYHKAFREYLFGYFENYFSENKLQNLLSFTKSKTLFIFGRFIPNLDKIRSFISFI